MADQRQQYGGGISTRNPYGRGGGSAWARNSQGARTNAQRMRAGRGMTEAKQYALKKGDELDRKFGFHLLPELLEQEEEARKEQPQDPSAADTDHAKLGWLLNLRACTLPDPLEGKHEVTGLELYFLEQDGRAFKTRVIYQPYFYVRPETNRSQDVIAYCLRKFEGLVAKAERVFREDLDMADHLNGKKALYVKLSFATVSDQMAVKRELAPLVARNQERLQARQAYEMQGQAREQVTKDDLMFGGLDADGAKGAGTDESESALLELREYDVPYPMRVAIDLDIRVGAWYHVDYDPTAPYAPSDVRRQKDMVDKAEPVVCAFDIECTKAPLKFPDAQVDQIYMISYMIDRQGYLIVNREFVSEEIQDFEYTPKEAYPGPFIVFNEENEEQLLKRFFEHVIDEKPHIFVTYNGDFFDWPFIDARAQVHGINMAREIGISLDERSGEYRGRCSVHMDAFCWVKRDSYLPQGSQGLKAVTKYKLGYDPVEVDAEDMVALARDEPLKMASYSVSDAVATFYLYDKYVHLFVFSLCTIIPLGSEDVLRKGSGTLCEALLMVEAFEGNIICPNKQSSAHDEKFYKGHLVENETYVGGHVECLESGVFRADFLYDFQLVPSAFQQFIDNVDRDLRFSLEVEMNVPLDRVANYEEVKKDIVDQLVGLRERPNRKEQPLIYHLDVAAMYPNIILTNRLQPCAIVNEADCAACAYNTECGRAAIKDKDASCQREMDWVWRGDFYPATRPEYYSIKTQLEYENFPLEKKGGEANADAGKRTNGAGFTVPFAQLPNDKQEFLLKQRFKSYCSSVYKKTKVTEEQKRSATVCMRENPFYVNTVRAFRDRRYEYKGLTKVWKKKVSQAAEAKDLLAKIDAQNKCLVYDSLQLAHKCILNSFYGYVMRKGARWHSMEMAGIVTHMGSNIITGARELVEQIGRPLELDTDGIWAILPKSFPETFSFKLKDGGSRSISYPCVMLNADVHAKFTNPQYHELDPASGKYNTHKECSILFEVDGPYKAMVLPASTEEGKLLKKRYAVFNFDHSLAELKGFELKRRGELQLIKAFQSQVFECFLDGDSLEECYASVAKCANRWLDVIDTRGKSMDDEELMTLITENKSMSGKLDEYEGQKSTSITTARRLGEFLGEEMLKDKGLTCKMIIAARPYGEKVTERAIPTAIFATEDAVKKHFLKKWLKDPHLQDFDIRSILDWDYYRTRFASTVQKIISLPAAFQNVRNPVPRIELPDWMRKQVREKNAKHQQGNMKQFFKAAEKGADNGDYVAQLIDMEDLIKGKQPSRTVNFQPRKRGNKASNDTGGSSPIEEIDDDDIEHVPAAKVKLGEVPFTDWLKNRKKKWKSMLGKRRREREERMRNFSGAGGFGMANSAHGSAKRFQSGTTSVLASKGNGVGMENFVFNAGSALQREYWQIVEIQQEQGGIFTCWVLTAHSRMLQRITLKMPRVFYITCQEDDQDTLLSLLPGSRRVSRIVPHYSSKPQSVLEVMLSERQYQQYHKEISQILGDPHVEGVYELQVSALTRAVCALGCVAKVVNPHLSSTKQEYELTDLQFQSTAQAPYLMDPQRSLANEVGPAPPNSLMRRVLLYFAQQKKRAILGLVVLKEEDDDVSAESSGTSISEGDANVWYVDPFSNVKSRGSDLRQFFDQLLLESQEEGGTTPIQSCSFKTHVVKTAAEAFSGVNATLARLASNKQLAPKPTIVVAQTCIPSSKRLREKMQGLHSFPIAMLPWNEEDTLFPALTWRKLMGEKMLTRCFEMTQYYSDVLDCARYAHLPVGNFTGDHSIAILDTLYSRILTKHKHLWWHSPTSLPDLGGKEQEQQFQQLFSQSLLGSAQQSSKKKGDAVSQHRVDTSVVVCEKGAFVDVCVELELDGLAVNAILVASQIHSIEGLGVAHQMEIDFEGNGESESNSKGDSAAAAVAEGDAEESCHEAFRLLRVMVTTLFKDFLANRNKFADHVLQQFYRWLCSPNSLSFDPALHAMVKRLMEKLFLQLLAEFRRLGSQIVYADFSKIIVCTKKKSVRDAQTYLNFILQTVLSNELFQVLNFTPKKYFSNLFFLDAENYGCILLKNVVPEEDEEEESDHDVDGSDQKPLEIVSHWNIANYLPRGVDEYFLILVGQFIRRRAEFQLRERRRLSKGGDAKADVVEDVEDQPLDEDEKQLSPLAKYSQRLVSSYFSDKMLRLVPEILTYNMDRDSFPVFAGSHLSMESPALELVKCVSAVFLLEPSVEAQVGKMKRTLLKLLRMSEFADESQFRNPSLSFTVQDVICLCCNLCRSVDLCRDPQLFKGSASRSDEDDERQEGEDAEATTAWHCPRCFALYDKTAFEMRLVEMVQAQSVAYQLQDLYCSKCLLPAEHKMREYCPCSGTYALMPGVRESLIETLRLLNRIAQQHNFEWLLETVQRLEREAAQPLLM